MNQRNLTLVVSIIVVASPLVVAQKNEVSFSVGGIITSDQHAATVVPAICCFPPVVLNTALQTAPAFSFGGSYARRLVKFGPASLYAEVPVLVVPGRDVNASTTGSLGPGLSVSNSATFSSSLLFVTPSAKVKFLEGRPISPFATVGGGVAHSNSDLGVGGVAGLQFSFSSNTGAFQFGGGLDFKSPITRLGFRAEVRDFYAGSRAEPLQQGSVITTTLSPVHLHHVFAGGGAFWRF